MVRKVRGTSCCNVNDYTALRKAPRKGDMAFLHDKSQSMRTLANIMMHLRDTAIVTSNIAVFTGTPAVMATLQGRSAESLAWVARSKRELPTTNLISMLAAWHDCLNQLLTRNGLRGLCQVACELFPSVPTG
ncbi:MAG: hypothetical protein Q9219_004260 [cf. Caloplaca sp. 3 TL-2023]